MLLLAVACGDGGARERAAAQVATQLADLQRTTAEKDSLLSDVMEDTHFITTIGEELDKVRQLPHGAKLIVAATGEKPMPVSQYRDSVLARIRELTARLDESEAGAAASRTRVTAAPSPDPKLLEQIARFDTTIADLRERLAAQETELTGLRAEVGTLRQDKVRLTADRDRISAEKAAADEKVLDLAEAANTVFYITGTRAQLIELGVVQEEGGAKGFLGFGSRKGQTLVPGRDLHESDFKPLSKTGNRDIALPAGKSYTIVSQQSPSYLTPVDKDGVLRGSVRVTDPDAFWRPSKFLILVEM